MSGVGTPVAVMVILCGALLAQGGGSRAAEVAVDRATQVALSLEPHPERGAAHFDRYCATCHGAEAHGDGSRGIPAVAGQRFPYLVRQLANFAAAERDSPMHRMILQQELTGPQAWVDIAAYLSRAPLAASAQAGDGMHLGLGRGIFHEECAGCHRPDGQGDGFVPSLRNQHFAYLVNQLHAMGEGSRHNVDENLVRFWRSFDATEVAATADYLSRLQGAGNVHEAMHDDELADR